MLDITISELRELFLNKVCTVFTTPTCRTFTDRVWREHFAVRVLKITKDGIIGEHPYTKMKSFFMLNEVVFIQEEIELDPSDPQVMKMIEEYEKETGKKIVSDVSPHLAPEINRIDSSVVETVPVMEEQNEEPESEETVFVDIDSLDALVKFTKNQNQPIQFPANPQNDLVQIQ